ncbi:autophagy-related protein 9A [Uranotaenia lowii]|uniref:autophagy-related protein 9A n=1 Tax=Uranotaenia lowii TaxID=190385 RepID=UPI002479BEF8|nr:autophagy-related protein 9A [Uranotaenia lowii]XP_055613223.1 autophagy-related protein 9A [Uranotaenia lowii]XP_055613224.1 autophagy-related protein 9A [Uranotaenia lowii]XP_055613225.1 autophagy-related protein 9A [Uranotaenia lowii]XP_055613226.1 autophagy-related protein 9A [Uranotaenia lowii]
MAKQDTRNYDTLTNQETNPFADKRSPTIEEEETPQSSGLVIHVVPDTNKVPWNHIQDLDLFFSRVYSYHQQHGFFVMMLQNVFELFQFVFVVILITYMINCVDYGILFNDNPEKHKIALSDAIDSPSECVAKLGGFDWLILLLVGLFWTFRLFKFFYHFTQYWDIRLFFNSVLQIKDDDLDNLTWHEVQKRIREVQSEIQMSINKEQLTELDIYHRILRFKNYMVAMMNKSLLPSTIKLPFLGNVACLSQALRYNVELILFWGPWAPFENKWHLRDEFKRSNRRLELSQKLEKQILWVAVVNIILSPFIFLCQLMLFFFNYVHLIKKEPGTLGMRCWSQYGKLHLRHFNELDHELDARLTRAYRPAVKYMNSFSSPVLTVVARNISFISGTLLSIGIVLVFYDEDFLQVQHVLSIMTVLGAVSVITRSTIPDENMVRNPEQLLRNVLAHVHYLPASWRNLAHTTGVRNDFEQFFQLKIMYILNELFSPFVAPFVLLRVMKPKALDLVDFFRNFTVDVIGVGDVCSFAQMDVRKHGNPDWQVTNSAAEKDTNEPVNVPIVDNNQYTQGEHGKTELSLVHFTLTNPTWQMPPEARHFVQGIKRHALQDLNRQRGPFMGATATVNPMAESLYSMESLGEQYQSIIYPILQTHNLSNSQQLGLSMHFGGFGSPPPAQPTGGVPPHLQQSSMYAFNSPPAPAFDFERMLQRPLTDDSTVAPLRSTFLHDINENDDDESGAGGGSQGLESSGGAAAAASSSHQHMQSSSLAAGATAASGIMDPRSSAIRTFGGMSKLEGPAEGSRNGLLSSLCGTIPVTQQTQHDLTAADMCLSTLYLHELYHNHMRRRGGSLRTDQSQQQQWQKPHQQQSPSVVLPGTSSSGMRSSMASTSQAAAAAERMPLLGSKKS